LAENLIIAEKRKLFLELTLKLLFNKEKKYELKYELLEKFNKLVEKFNTFKDSVHRIIDDIRLNILQFLNTSNILENIHDLKLKKYILASLNEFSIELAQIKNKESLVIPSVEDYGKIKQAVYDIKEHLNSLNEIKNDLEKLENWIAINEEKYKKPNDFEQKIKDIIITKFNFIKKFKLEDNKAMITSFLQQFEINFLKFFKNKKLNFAFIQLKRAFNENRLDNDKILSFIDNTLLIELMAALILYLLQNDLEINTNELAEITHISPDKILKALILLIDRHLIALDESDDYKYKLISQPQEMEDNIKIIMQNIKSINNYLNNDFSLNLLNKFKKLYEKYSSNSKLFSQDIPKNLLKSLKNKTMSFNHQIFNKISPGIPKKYDFKIAAAIELYNMRNFQLIFEKSPYLEISAIDQTQDISEMDKFLEHALSIEMNKALIITAIKHFGPMTPSEISKLTKINQKEIVDMLLTLIIDGKLEIIGQKEEYFLYDIIHIFNEHELFLKNLFELISSLQKSLNQIVELSHLNIENFSDFYELIKLINSIRLKLNELEYPAIEILVNNLNAYFSDLDYFINTCSEINESLKSQEIHIQIENLVPIKIPKREDEIETDYGQYIIGFGKINWELEKCIGCRSCVDICPESALRLSNEWDISRIFKMQSEELDLLPENKRLVFQFIQNLALKTPSKPINLPEQYLGLGNIEIFPIKCIACKKCEERCPNNAIQFENVWDLPEIIKEYVNEIIAKHEMR